MRAALERYQLCRPALTVIASETQCERYVEALVDLEKQAHRSAEDRKYGQLLAALIEKYERERYPVEPASPLKVLAELIQANGLRQKDLAGILGGHESVVSEIVNGKRPLSKTHIEKLSRRFNVSPAVFFPRAAASQE
ncbi:MAG: helix-turn-helix domain-containing protein [Candidatus Acidiferrales bacterium]